MSLKTSPASRNHAGEKLVEPPAPDRRCTRCGDLDQSRPVSIYSPDNACCPVCNNPEFSPVYTPEWEAYLAAISEKSQAEKPKKGKKTAIPEDWISGTGQAPAAPSAEDDKPVYALLDVDRVFPDPKNPRKIEESDPTVQELIETAKKVGILEPLLVRIDPYKTGDYRIMAGHRRYFSALWAGLRVVPCLIYRNATEATATEIRILENLQRKDLSAIETARELQAAMVDLNLNQGGLATRFKKSQAWVSHHLRLLNLPEFLQDEITEGRLTKTQGRELAVFADVPAVIDEFVKAYRNCSWGGDDDSEEFISREDFDGCLEAGLETGTRPITSAYRVPFTPTPEQLKLLDVREVIIEGDRERVAVNVELWEQLKVEAEQARKAESAKRNKEAKKARAEQTKGQDKGQADDAGEDDSKQDQETDADASENDRDYKASAERAALNKKIFRYYVSKLQDQLLERAGGLDMSDLFRWLIGLAASGSGPSSERRSGLAAGIAEYRKVPAKPLTAAESWNDTSAIELDECEGIVRQWFKSWCRIPSKSWGTDATPAAVLGFAKVTETTLRNWKVDREFLLLHSIDELRDLAAEWGIQPPSGAGKTELLEFLLANASGKPMPNSLRNVEVVTLD